MPRSSARLLAAVALAIALPSTADAQIFGRRNDAPSAPVVNETPKCTQNLGTLTIADTQGALFGQMGLGAPSQLLRVLVRDSGCFTLIERGPGMDVVERERGLGAAGRIRTADFVLVAELGNPIQSDSGDNRPGLLGTLSSAGSRALLQAGVAALTQGQGGDMSDGMGQLIGRAANATANVAGGQLDQAFSRRTVDAIQTVKKDIAKGKEDAQVVFSLSSVPLAETVGNVRAAASKDDVRRLRVRNNQFGGRVGGGYETEDEGKILALAFVRGYADLVTSLGGLGHAVPEVTLANREASRAEENAPKAEGHRRNSARAEIAPQATTSRAMSSRSLARASILRSAPNGEIIRPLAADDRVFPTGKQDGDWLEVLDSDENIGWMQGDRLAAEH